MAAKQPSPPESLPKYLAEGVPKQDDNTLRELQRWIDELIEYRADISADEIEVNDEESLEAIDDTGGTTTVIKNVPCGKDACSTCPHGPYRYEVYRDDGSLVWEYKGAVDE
jgi:hypothetical protein